MDNSRRKWMILVIVDILVCTAILLGISYIQSSKIITGRMEEEAQIKAESYAQEMSGWITGYARVLNHLASEMSQEHVIDQSEGGIHAFLNDNLLNINTQDEISDLYYTTPDNHMITAGEYIDDGSVDYVHDREWYVNAAAGTDICYSRPYKDSLVDHVVITLSRSVRESGNLRGVLCADIYLDTIIDKVNEAEVDEDSYAFLVDSVYDMVVHPDPEFKFDDEPKSMLAAKSVDYSILKTHIEHEKDDVHYIDDYDGVERAFALVRIPEMDWFVGIATSKSVMMKDIRSIMYVFIIAGMATLLIGSIIFIVFTSRVFKSRNVSGREALRKFGLRNILISLAAVLFFIALIIVYVSMLYNSSKEEIKLRGELHSIESSNLLEKYISQSTTIAKQTQYELDYLIDSGCSEQEIHDYLVDNTKSIQNSVDENYTGLYAYINGKYFDGADWVPDAGWVATERPWYKKAIEADGKVALVEPYIDAQTGMMTMTAAVAMNDRKNVCAIDVAFEMMKAVTGNTGDAGGKIEIILDSKGSVIAHTDYDEIGKNYREEDGTLGAAVADKLFSTNEQCFELEYNNVDYVVYNVKMNEEWYSLTLIDSRESYRPLSYLVIVTVFVIVLTVAILLLIFINISSKSLAMERMNVQLSATSDIYVTAHDIDMVHDTFTNLHTSERLLNLISEESDSAREALYNVTAFTTMSDTRDAILEFVDLDTIDERMEGRNTIAMEFHAKDGRWLRGRFIVSERKPDGNIAHVLWLVESVDEEKKRRDELRDMSARAIAESEAKSSFLSNMSHEIRTPITAVLGMNEMVLRECEDQNIINYAESIETAGRTLLGLVNDILDFSKIEAGKMEIIPVEYDVASVLNDLVNMTQIRIEEKGLILNLDFNPKLPNLMFGDEVRVKQIITNILTNAVKYTERGSVTFGMTYVKDPIDQDSIIMIAEVRDTGIGIKKEDMDKLFSRFDRIEEERNRNIEGTGLGMTITKRLIDLMGGTMEVESEYGKGSMFRVSIKQKVVDWNPIGDYEEAYRKHVEERDRYQQIFTAPDAKVLIVDDTQMNLMVFKSLLKSTEVQIDTAKSGDEGLKLMKEKAYDVIFLDHMMPGKDGIQTLKELHESGEGPNMDVPVICLTANAISGAREMYIKAGFDNYLSKPIDSSRLEEMMVEYIPAEKVRYVMSEEKVPEKRENTAGQSDENIREDSGLTPTFMNKSNQQPDESSPLYRPHEGINIAGAIDGMGSEEAFRPILDIFYETIDETADEIEELYQDENWEDYTIQVHALKSSARIVGALDLGEEAFAMEMAGKNRDLDYIHENHEQLMEHYRHFKDVLSDIYEESADEPEEAEKETAGEVTIAGWYERIRAGAEEMDIDMLEAVFEEVREYSLPAEDAERMRELEHLAGTFDYDTITEILDTIG
ncbi:MAG: response regulator [Eubacterium sp.]|nr:response regulator [Eubacterium sp.]